MPSSPHSRSTRASHVPLWTMGIACLLWGGWVWFSQLGIPLDDEGYHLLAAKLIRAGKRPYLDFFFQQMPLYPYLSAVWMQVFGESWRSAHLLSTLFLAATAVLLAGFSAKGWFDPSERTRGRWVTMVFFGLSFWVIRTGTVGQPYAACQFFSVAALWATREADSRQWWVAVLAGLCAGLALGCSLLTAPVGPVLAVWLVIRARSGQRLLRLGQFALGSGIALLPVAALAWVSPEKVWFNLFEFHLLHRTHGWETWYWDLKTVTGWLDSLQGLCLSGLTGIALLAAPAKRAIPRAELAVVSCLALGLGFFLACTRPTFPQYFSLMIPFMSLLAARGWCLLCTRMWPSATALRCLVITVVLFAGGLVRSVYQGRHVLIPAWPELEKVAAEIDRVNPNGGWVYTNDESLYFLIHSFPPPGMENSYGRDLKLPPSRGESLGLVPESLVEKWLAAGRFATVCLHEDDPIWKKPELLEGYPYRRNLYHYTILSQSQGSESMN